MPVICRLFRRNEMKKIALVSAVLLLIGTAAFAEITWGGGGRTVLVPFGYRGENSDTDAPTATYFGAESPYSGDGPRISLSLTGKRDEGNMGFNFGFFIEHADGTFFPQIDDKGANVWLKPFGGALQSLTGTFGMFNIDKLRYKFAGSGSSFHNYVMYIRGDLTGEDDTFRRFQSSGFGTHLSYEPVEALWLGVGLGSVGNTRSFAGEFKEDGFINALKNAQIGAGYTIKDIGLIRAQWIGFVTKDWTGENTPEWKNTSLDKTFEGTGDAGKFQAAFNLTAVPGVSVDLGLSVPMVDEKDYWDDVDKTNKEKTVTIQNDFVASIGADITGIRPFRLWALASLKFGGYTETAEVGEPTVKVNNGTDVAVMLNPWYYLSDTLMVVGDIFLDTRFGSDSPYYHNETTGYGYDSDPTINPDPDAKDNYMDLGFGLYLRKNIPGGDVRAGVTLKLPGGEAHKGAKPQFFIPVMFNYSF
jgi:hypothetical protein